MNFADRKIALAAVIRSTLKHGKWSDHGQGTAPTDISHMSGGDPNRPGIVEIAGLKVVMPRDIEVVGAGGRREVVRSRYGGRLPAVAPILVGTPLWAPGEELRLIVESTTGADTMNTHDARNVTWTGREHGWGTDPEGWPTVWQELVDRAWGVGSEETPRWAPPMSNTEKHAFRDFGVSSTYESESLLTSADHVVRYNECPSCGIKVKGLTRARTSFAGMRLGTVVNGDVDTADCVDMPNPDNALLMEIVESIRDVDSECEFTVGMYKGKNSRALSMAQNKIWVIKCKYVNIFVTDDIHLFDIILKEAKVNAVCVTDSNDIMQNLNGIQTIKNIGGFVACITIQKDDYKSLLRYEIANTKLRGG